jgi:putative membrane protein
VLVAGLVGAGAVYARGFARLGRRTRSSPTGRAVAFGGGLAVVAAALMSPLEGAAAERFSAHMVQHLLLMVVAAPLLAYARPRAALVAGLPEGGREAVRRVAALEGLRRLGRALVHPLAVWTIGALAVWAWHMPSLYDLALRDHVAHVLEHACFVAAAVLFWTVVLGSGARRGVPRPVATLLVFTSGVQSTALGAVLLFATTPLYQAHGQGSSALEDQQLAGALMWGPPALVYLITIGWLLVRWFAEMDHAPPDRALEYA